MILGPGSSFVATAAAYTISTQCGGAVSLRRAPCGSAVLWHRRRRRISRAQVLKTCIYAAASGVAVAKSKQQWSRYPLYWARSMRISYGRSRLQMCASCFVLMRQHDGTIGSGHGAARTRQEAGHIGRYGARRSCELYGSYLRSCQCPRYRTATEAARRMGVCSVHECVWGRLWVR